jgi:hypothetical protein
LAPITACLIGDDIQIDASIGTNFKETPSLFYGGVGISWRFDGDYSDVMLRIQKAKVKGKKDKKKKKKTILPGNV